MDRLNNPQTPFELLTQSLGMKWRGLMLIGILDTSHASNSDPQSVVIPVHAGMVNLNIVDKVFLSKMIESTIIKEVMALNPTDPINHGKT
jgi:hypothetical protein